MAEQISVGVFVQFLVTFPTGYVRDRFDRFVVGLAYALVAAWTLNELIFVGDWFEILCDPDCVRNVFVIWPDGERYDWLKNVVVACFCLVLIPLIIVALWRHWRGRRAGRPPACCSSSVLHWCWWEGWSKSSAANWISRPEPPSDSPSGVAIHLIAPMVLPAGLLVGLVRARWSRGRVASLVVELGRRAVGGLRDVLAEPSATRRWSWPSPPRRARASSTQPASRSSCRSATRSRTVTRLEREDELLGVLVHDPAIEAEDPAWWRRSATPPGWPSRTSAWRPRSGPSSRRSGRRGPGSSRPPTPSAAGGAGPPRRRPAAARRARPAAPGGQETTPGATALLDEATGELQTAIGEVRGLARGVHPTILTETGLRARSTLWRPRLPVTVDIPEKRYDPQLEAPPTSSSPRPSRTSPATPTRARPASRRSSTTAGWW